MEKEASGAKAEAKGQKERANMVQKETKDTGPLGKRLGKASIIRGEDDYLAAWGNEDEYYYGYDDWNYAQGDMNHVGNQMMLLEHKTKSREHDEYHDNSHDKFIAIQITTVTGGYDPLKSSRKPALVSILNKY